MAAEEGISRRDLFRRLGARGREVAQAKGRRLIDPIAKKVAPEKTVPAGRQRRAFPLHRPPGAIEEEQFLDACTKCGECAAACPHDAIIPAPDRLGRGGGTPTIQPMTSACLMCTDTPCILACEPRALRAEQPLRMAEARIQPWACLAHQGTFCSVCRERCPVPGAIAVENGRPEIIESICTGCGVCQNVCPAPENAILLMPLAERPRAPSLPGPGSDATP